MFCPTTRARLFLPLKNRVGIKYTVSQWGSLRRKRHRKAAPQRNIKRGPISDSQPTPAKANIGAKGITQPITITMSLGGNPNTVTGGATDWNM